MESKLRKQTVISELTKSPHGKLEAYQSVGSVVAREDPEFLAHLIAWNQKKGQVRDAKIALPVLAIRTTDGVPGRGEFLENARAHLALQDPRTLLRGLAFARELKVRNGAIRPLVLRYLREREAKVRWWTRTAVQHRESVKALYAHYGIKPSTMADQILFKRHYPGGSVFEVISQLKNMEPVAAASAVVKYKIPFLVAKGALGKGLQDTDVLLAVIKGMTPAELVTNMQALEKLGVKQVPALRAAMQEALAKAAESRKSTTPSLKATRAQAAVTDEATKAKLGALQEKQLKELEVDGDWLVLGDKSGSMEHAIDLARTVAATLAKAVKGEVRLTFFDTMPRSVDVTGKTYEEILQATRHVSAGGGTAIGAGLLQAVESGFVPDGIAVVSDGEENCVPSFASLLKQLVEREGKQIPVYFYRVRGGHNNFSASMAANGMDLQEFDLTGGADYYSLPNLIRTMRANRYSLVQEILDTPLKTLDEVFRSKDKDDGEEREEEERG